MSAKYVLKRTTTDNTRFHFNLYAENGRIILTSQVYESKAAAENGIASVRKNSPDDKNYERKKSGVEFMFNLKSADNGLVIGTSQRYESEANREKGIESVKKNGPKAPLEDQT